MIKFFRKIRQKLLSEGKTGQYLKYALGEIVLVMVGILLALQVNEWNNERIRKIAEQTTIEQLINDLSRSQYQLEEVKEYNLRAAREFAQALRVFWKSELPEDIKEYRLIRFGSSVYSPVLGTAVSLINSGKLDILSSQELKNNIVEYVEAVGYNLKDINRYEESYFRKAIDLRFEAIPNTFEDLEEINESIQDRNAGRRYKYNINTIPDTADKVPFKTSIEGLFEDERYFRALTYVHLYHRNISGKYDQILDITNELLVELYKASKKYESIGEHLGMSSHYLVFDEVDLEILQGTDALLNDSSKWNKNDDLSCDDQIVAKEYSLRCALYAASEEVVGVWFEDPLRPAMRLVLMKLKKYENRRVVGDPLKEWNDHPETTFEELKLVLKESLDEVKKQLNYVTKNKYGISKG